MEIFVFLSMIFLRCTFEMINIVSNIFCRKTWVDKRVIFFLNKRKTDVGRTNA